MRRWGRYLIAAAVLAAFLLSAPVAAQAVCGERDRLLAHLRKTHGERPIAMGLTARGRMVEVLASDGGGWSIIVTDPNGGACLMATGEAWEAVEDKAKGPDA
ncbi:MAG: hypothetical protein QF578_19195 [Alphaproteobacteria bacterium]|jgi:hypothetical protein|nr:hypothetical protein [Alphaproteobacteria bacterium]MDP6566962.1 hypothetical protein [Alphaproteobacteria bacterium]MDP6813762.1 hypothetical protein [Alphaproteobacteria bacterium]